MSAILSYAFLTLNCVLCVTILFKIGRAFQVFRMIQGRDCKPMILPFFAAILVIVSQGVSFLIDISLYPQVSELLHQTNMAFVLGALWVFTNKYTHIRERRGRDR